MIKRSRGVSYNPVTRVNAPLQWSMTNHKLIEKWDPRLRVDQVWNTADFRKERWHEAMLASAGVMAYVPMGFIRHLFSLYVVQLRLG